MTGPRLTRALTLEERRQVPDGSGGFSESWTVLGHVWAEVQFRSGRAADLGGVAGALSSYRIILRAAPVGSTMRPRPGQRLCEGPRRFQILAVGERDPDGRFLTCIAQEEAAA